MKAIDHKEQSGMRAENRFTLSLTPLGLLQPIGSASV